MSTGSADVAVVGLGVIGLSTVRALARRGHRAIGLDRFGSGHPATSSTGPSRSIRLAYDRAGYVALARDAIERWRRLERDLDERILLLTGQIDLGPDQKLEALADGMRAADVPFGSLGRDEVSSRFPELRLGPGDHALFHADAGTVLADVAMRSLWRDAVAAGAELSAPEAVTRITIDAPGVVLTTTHGRVIRAATAVLAAGPWMGDLLAQVGLAPALAPAVAQVTFLAAPSTDTRPGIADWQIDARGVGVYGHPVPGIGYKVAFDAGSSDPWDPDTESWEPDLAEAAALARWIDKRMPSLAERVDRHQRHPWTMTPDGDFVIDRRGPLVIAGGCSGHAFKFGPALGELVADLVDGLPRSEAEMFALDRGTLRGHRADATMPIVR